MSFLIVPIFGLVNAGAPSLDLPAEAMRAPVILGATLGLLAGKPVGVFGLCALAIRPGWADAPAHASRPQMLGVALLCGIGFTMSLFTTFLAFPGNDLLQSEAKIGILAGSLLSGLEVIRSCASPDRGRTSLAFEQGKAAAPRRDSVVPGLRIVG